MPLQPGSRIGAYEIIGVLGAGGMGEVYRARDSKLGREVAIKVLPEPFASDHDRIARFEREAQVLASLNHPHIAQIHGFETAHDSHALIMELVDGPTLADRLRAGPIPLDEALPIARQIAEALEAAHERGIIHRDLKPANVKVAEEGVVKVLDFGLAKAIDPPAAAAAVSQSPTLSIHATQAGVVLGTAAYMAPEQARGKPADARADIWAFGVVFFEMLAGRSPFEGEEISDILASVLKTEPQWNRLPRDLPVSVGRLLRRCLQKDRRQRLQHIGDARLELDEAMRGDGASQDRRGVSMRERVAWFGALLLAAVAIGVLLRPSSLSPPPEMRVEVSTPNALVMGFSLSPDAQSIAYTGRSERGVQIWIRDLSSGGVRAVKGTEGGEYPFWSPDGRHLGFFAGNRLKRISVDGGAATTLAFSLTPAGGSWGPDGTILYVPSDNGPVRAISDSEKGGRSQLVTRASERMAARLPQFLPGGRRFLFYVSSGIQPGVYVGELNKEDIKHVTAADWPALFVANHLLFVRDGTLYSQRFDPNSAELRGSPRRLSEDVFGGLFAANISVSNSGVVGYRTGPGARAPRRLVWFDRSGKRLQTVGEEGGLMSNPSLSPDGRYVALQRTTNGNIDIWIIDLQRNAPSRLTEHPSVESLPLWSPDSARIALNQSVIPGGPAVIPVDRPSEITPLGIESGRGQILTDWSSDGNYIMFKAADAETGANDLWVLPLNGDRKPFAVASGSFDERDGQFSPNGRWIAFESDESGTPEIYIQPFQRPGRRIPVSTGGGTQVRWRADGRELYYVDPNDNFIAVSITDADGGLSIGAATKLFSATIAPVRAISRQQYVVSRDGQRFLIVNSDAAPVPPVTLLLNWRGGAER